jgi:archaeal cell division control protein 6
MYQMFLFDDILKDSESIFINEQALDFDYTPREIPFRENQLHYIADIIKPLFQKKPGRNLFITGDPYIDKATAVKLVLRELNDKTKDIFTIYTKCLKKETNGLRKVVSEIRNKKLVVIALEGVENLKEVEILNTLSKNSNKKCILMISDDKDWLNNLDERIRTTLNADTLTFKPYTYEETFEILRQRSESAFVPDTVDKEAIELIAKRAFESGDIRMGIFLLRESGNIAERNKSKKVLIEHVKKAIERLEFFKERCDS